MIVDLEEGERQFVLLSLALCVLLRPGFKLPAETISDKLNGREMYEGLMWCNEDVVKPQGGLL